MIRFKVIRASRLCLCLAILLLAAVAAAILFSSAGTEKPPSDRTAASLVNAGGARAAKPAFAASDSAEDPAKTVIEVEVVPPTAAIPAEAPAPSVLIYHTHTHEAYEQDSADPYEALEAWRTLDDGHSVVRVGEALAHRLRALGFDVVHDATDHEGNELSTAYTRSLETLSGYTRRFDLYIDLHRDAYSQDMAMRCTGPGGEPCAQLMLLIGNGEGFDVKPFYTQNLAFARALTRRVNGLCPGMCRDVLVKDGRYNQHIGIFSVLVEVGHNRNTLEEALNAVPVLADALRDLMIDAPEPELEALRTTVDPGGRMD